MVQLSRIGSRNSAMQAAVGFALGAVGGCMLGATEEPVALVLSALTAAQPLQPLMDEVRTVGALGLGTLVGSTALTTAVTSAVAGVILAAVVVSMFVASRIGTTPHKDSAGLWVSAAVAGAVGSTLSGATMGALIQWIVNTYGMVGLLWALSVFTLIKPALLLLLQRLWGDDAPCSRAAISWTANHEQTFKDQPSQREVELMEQRILALEKGGDARGAQHRLTLMAERKEREERERKKREKEEAEMEQRTIQEWIRTVMVKHVDFLAFSGIPMTVIAMVTAGFGVLGYGGHQAVFIVLLVLVTVMAYLMLSSSDFKFWMLVGCMGMIATFVIAMLTLHAGQVVVTKAIKMQKAGEAGPSRENISLWMNQQSSLEALNSALFVARLCQLGLGATVGGTLVRRELGEGRVILGAAAVGGVLLVGVESFAPVIGEGGRAGALLGVVEAAGVSAGAAAAMARGWSSWAGTLGTVTGLVLGALAAGSWHQVNIGLQVPAVFVFSMTTPF